MVERLLNIGNTQRRHLFAITFVVVFQFVTRSERMVRNAAVIDPLLACECIKVHFDRHEVAHLHGLIKFAEGKGRVVVPIAINAMGKAKRNRHVAPVHIKWVKAQTVLTHIKAQLHAGIVGKVVHEGALYIRKFVVQIKVDNVEGIHQIQHVADVGGTASHHPAGRALMAFGMNLGSKGTDLDAGLAEPFIDRILATGTTIHLEHGT